MDSKLLEILACPICKAKLNYHGDALSCKPCKLAYPILDGIPVLIADQTISLADYEKSRSGDKDIEKN